jgi:hypothetical protein
LYSLYPGFQIPYLSEDQSCREHANPRVMTELINLDWKLEKVFRWNSSISTINCHHVGDLIRLQPEIYLMQTKDFVNVIKIEFDAGNIFTCSTIHFLSIRESRDAKAHAMGIQRSTMDPCSRTQTLKAGLRVISEAL